MNDPTMDTSNCGCKYCSKKSQREITSAMDFLPNSRPTANASRDRPYPKRHRDQRVFYRPYVAVQRKPTPLNLAHAIPMVPASRERNSDLRAAYATATSGPRREFRESELLWCHLDPPIQGNEDGVSIDFWPGIVEGVKLVCEPRPMTEDVETTSTPHSKHDAGQDDMPQWTVHQYIVYKMKLLAVAYSYTVTREEVLPYQGYIPSSNLMQVIRDVLWAEQNLHPDTLAAFNPCPAKLEEEASSFPSKKGRFAAAVVPYALAIQIAAKLAGFWSLTDEWDFKYMVTPGAAITISRPESSAGSVGAGSGSLAAGSTTSSLTRNISDPSTYLTPSELRDRGTRRPAYPAQAVVQTRYQGIWWGAERIWMDELVRVKLARRQIAPEGRPDIYPPARPSRNTLEYNAKHGHEPNSISDAEFGAGGRGVFMRLEGLFVVDVPREDGLGTRKECRASGMLYELADEDWEDPYAGEHQQYALGQMSRSNVDPQLLGATGPNEFAGTQTPNTGLSQPTQPRPYPLPPPPTGFKFRPILHPGFEGVIALGLLAGRYYPRILAHPLIQPAVQQTYANSLEDGGLHGGDHLWALEGLSPGFFNPVDPVKAKPSRKLMLKDADGEAREDVEEACNAAREQLVVDYIQHMEM
jgi:hypothetical protein